jgi:creatinine amidohydrolase
MARASRTDEQTLPVQWEDLTASDFPEAVRRSEGVCILPAGVIETHGPHLPLATDVLIPREIAIRAARQEYAVVFPFWYFGKIYEPGAAPCISLRAELYNALLQNMCEEMARVGFEKIVILNGHGGNTAWLQFFCWLQLDKPRNYVVYLAERRTNEDDASKIAAEKRSKMDGHAGESETSMMLAVRPDLVQLDRMGDWDGMPQRHLEHLDGYAYTTLRWYSDFPNQFASDGVPGTAELGQLMLQARARALAETIRVVKKDDATRGIQDDFFWGKGPARRKTT